MQRAPWLWLVVLVSACYDDASLEVEENLELEQLEGRWHEIAKLPRDSQRDCTRTTVTYSRVARHELTMSTRCHLRSTEGPVHSAEAAIVVPDVSQPAKLALDFGFFLGEHWVLDLGSNPDILIVGHPSRQYLWILSRTPQLSADALTGALEQVAEAGFDVDALEYTEH